MLRCAEPCAERKEWWNAKKSAEDLVLVSYAGRECEAYWYEKLIRKSKNTIISIDDSIKVS
jgi:hypothetical protein